MNPEKQRIAIAEFCGWVKIKLDYAPDGQAVFETFWWHPSFGEPNTADIISQNGRINPPDYLNDLNAIHEAEKLIMDESSIIYVDYLSRISCLWHATAAQRAEAFLKTLNLWEE